jgi:hypothetical protein
LLLIARGLDGSFLDTYTGGDVFAVALLAVAIAATNLTAIWSVMGRGPVIVRLALLVAVPVILHFALQLYTQVLRTKFPSWSRPIISIYFNVNGHWLTWLLLDAALTAALLLFLRGSGYYLSKSSRSGSA